MQGTHLVDGNGNTIQLRGVNVSGLEFTAIQGFDPGDPWGGMKPITAALQSWDINVLRLPLNEQSWLGGTCNKTSTGETNYNPDPGGNYHQTVIDTVNQATAAGMYVILDLHWNAPKPYCGEDQNPMADADNSPAFWTSIANTFKSNPAVLFEMYNEPFLTDWNIWLNGGSWTGLRSPNDSTITWQVAGMQTLINTVRQTGATNMILIGGLQYSNDLTQFTQHMPTDPMNNLAAIWHVYSFNQYVDPSAGSSTVNMLATVSAKVPLITTEIGDAVGAGQGGFAKSFMEFFDNVGYSYLAWTWDPWGQSSNVLITDENGTPTQGFGQYVMQHYICRASSTNCQ